MLVWVVSLLAKKLIPPSLTAKEHVFGIRSLIGVGKLVGPLVHSVLYPRYTTLTLSLKTFRREPDISEFDWPFTPIHSSSPKFSTLVGSVLHFMLLKLQPDHGQITRFRVQRMILIRPIQTWFPYGSILNSTQPSNIRLTRWLIMQKARHHPASRTLTACKHTVSGSISLSFRSTFHLSLTVLVHYRLHGSIQPCQVVLADSSKISRVPPYLGTVKTRFNVFTYRTITFYGESFQILLLTLNFLTCQSNCNQINNRPATPILQNLQT